MNILAIGDVTEPRAAEVLATRLWEFRRRERIDFVLVNAENAGFIMGPDPDLARLLLDGGADVLTGGNHTLQRQSLHGMLENDSRLLRPLNYPAEVPGMGYTILPANGYRILVMNAQGRVEMEPLDCPFHAVDRVLEREAGHYDFSILDFHAEATGEKLAMGHYLDGRVNIVYGTHTHVPTADEQILPRGTAYQTDIGMCGPRDGILGMAPDSILRRLVTRLPERYAPATGEIAGQGTVFSFSENDGRVGEIRRVTF